MKRIPPNWADKFLAWYCRADLLEEIQGDVYELYDRTAKQSKRKADFLFIWNVLRFFRWKNIQKINPKNYTDNQISVAMIRNIFIVAFRNFFRQPVHSTLNLFGLAIGFLCAFLILLWVSHEFSFDRFHKGDNTLFKVLAHVEVEGAYQTFDMASSSIDLSSIPEIENKVTVIEGTRWPNELCFRPQGKANECIYLNGIYASESLFSVLNFPIIQGDTNPLKDPKHIAISQNMAEKLFGAEDAVGKVIKIDDHLEVTIASVFENTPVNSTLRFDFAMPFSIVKSLWGIGDGQFNSYAFPTFIRTNHETTAEALTEKLNAPLVLSEEYRKQNIKYQAYPFADWRLKSKFENGKIAGGRIEYIYIFIAIGVMVLLMAIINFINMVTARSTTRAKEIGIRKVTGALRGSIIFQFLSESFIMVFFAFIIAILLTQLSLPYFNQLLAEPISMQWYKGTIPVYMVTGMLVVVLAAGLYPAFVMSSFQPVKILKNQTSSKGSGSERLRKALLVVQLSISIGIIIFSGVMYQQLNFITTKDMGFERSNTVRVEPTFRLLKNFDALKNELQKNASIIGVATSNVNPLSSEPNINITWSGKPDNTRIAFQAIGCSYEFPATIGVQLKEGRDFVAQVQDSLYNEAIITEDAAKIMGLTQPLGEHMNVNGFDCVIIGIAKNFHTAPLQHARLPVVLYRIKYEHSSAFYVRYQPGTTQQSMATISEAYKKIEPAYTMRYWFQDDSFDELYKTEMIASKLILAFTIITLVIATIGIIGLSTYNTLRRTKEIGVRKVLGASIFQVLRMLFNEFSIVLLIAIVIAGPLAWYASHQWLTGYAYRTTIPWWVFAITFLGVTLLIAVIVGLQGIKTASLNPTKTLRTE